MKAIALVFALIISMGSATAGATLEAPPAEVTPVVTPLPNTPAPLTASQMNELLAYLITGIGAFLVRPLSALLQSWGVTAKIDARLISSLLSLVLVTGLGWKQGVYGSGPQGILYALAAGAFAFMFSYGSNRASSLAAEGGTRRAFLGRAQTKHGDTTTQGGLLRNSVDDGLPVLQEIANGEVRSTLTITRLGDKPET